MNNCYRTQKLLFFILLLLLFTGCRKTKKAVILPDRGNGGITLPANFGVVVWVDTLGRGRHIIVNDNGDVYVQLIKLNTDC